MTRYWPLAHGSFRFGSPFGPRDGGFHAGQDFEAADGTPFYSCAAGTVLYLGAAQGYGQWIVIDHPAAVGGGVTEYGHMWHADATGLRVGDRVEGGQLLGYVGSNGESSGPHLHLSVMPYGYAPETKVDPMAWLTSATYPQGGSVIRGLDFAGGRPGAAAIRDAGFDFVVRYLSHGGASLPGKLLLPDEAQDYLAHGVHIVSNWETYADRMKEGRTAGIEDAQAALAQVLACGGRTDRPIYFSADWDATEADQCAIDEYLRGAAEVIGAENVGIYGGYWPVSRALDHGTAAWAWQAEAWSGWNVDPRIHLLQRNSVGYVNVGGVDCDVNEARQADYGQWSIPQEEPMNDEVLGDIREQLCGSGQREPGQYGGWSQLGGLTLVDAVALIGEHLGLDGFATGGRVDGPAEPTA